MTRFATRGLKQDAVLWMASGSHDKSGTTTIEAPVPIKVRWIEGRTEEQDPQGNTIVTDTTVIVDRVIKIESILWLGNIDDVPDSWTDSSLRQVVVDRDTPSWNNRSNRRSVGAIRFGNTLPTLA